MFPISTGLARLEPLRQVSANVPDNDPDGLIPYTPVETSAALVLSRNSFRFRLDGLGGVGSGSMPALTHSGFSFHYVNLWTRESIIQFQSYNDLGTGSVDFIIQPYKRIGNQF